MKITFYGAAGEVTGSKHLIEDGQVKILLDCGMEQGYGTNPNQSHLAFPGAEITAVVISHAHLDHVGLLPVLIRSGYRGRIYSTGATRDLAECILLDAAHLQEQDAAYAAKKRWPGYESVKPLYTVADVPAVMERWDRIPYQFMKSGWTECGGAKVKLYDAGHILGSAVTLVETSGQRIAYTGDLGRSDAPLLRNPDPVTEPTTTLILESTYGNRLHHPVDSVKGELVDIMKTTAARGGKVIVPAFSLGRTQELVYLLHALTDAGQLPRMPIYVDSPLASRITDVYEAHQHDYDASVGEEFTKRNEDPLAFSNLLYTHTVEESKALNTMPGPMVIISASGMASGGRIIHHLANNLADERNTILFTGYQAVGTLGRTIVDGAKRVKLFGQAIPVRAQIAIVNDLSAHADAAELEKYAASVPELKRVFLVHGEPDRALALQERLHASHPNWEIVIPTVGQSFELQSAVNH